jgi:hypothetical protein
MFQKLLCRLHVRHKTSAWASGALPGEGVWQEKNNSVDVQQSNYLLYLHSYKLTLAAMYLRRVRVVGRTFAAALAHVSKSLRRLLIAVRQGRQRRGAFAAGEEKNG